MKVHLVIAPGVDVIAVYNDSVHAHAHALTITGAIVIAMDVLDEYPTGVLDDILSDFDADQETFVEAPPPRTKPKTRP